LQANQRDIGLWVAAHLAAQVRYRLGDLATAERAERVAVERRRPWATSAAPDQRDLNERVTWLAMAVARQGRAAEAAGIITPVVKFQRELTRQNHGDQWQPLELAAALYAEALSDPQKSSALLHEAATLVDGLSPRLQSLNDVRQRRVRIQQAQSGRSAQRGAASAVRSAG
jgi:hypothetical protein